MDYVNYFEKTPEILRLAELCETTSLIEPELFSRYNVMRGLRDLNGKGVLAGLTHISDVRATKEVDGKSVPTHGRLFYRGYDIKDLVQGITADNRFGFEEITYLLLFGRLPAEEELHEFEALLGAYRTLPTSFVRDIIMKAPSKDMM
ncbi:MAG: citrate synthase, partial [Lachnospiraceae bacterium]|nr:citrate synthase [Lachnospiraceae bacterium]